MLKEGWPKDGVIDEWFEGTLETAYARRYPNLLAIFKEGLARYPDQEIFIFPTLNQRYTRRRLDEVVRKVAASLKEDYGITKGDRVAMILLNNPEFCISYLAIAAVGAISVVINARLETDELAYQLRDSGARLVIVENELYERVKPLQGKLENLETVVTTGDEGREGTVPFSVLLAHEAPPYIDVEVGEKDICSICYTSGTTGRPKGSIITHRNVCTNAQALLSCMPYLLPEKYTVDDIYRIKQMISVPLFHVTALHTLFNLCLLGASAVVLPVFQADQVIESMIEEEVNFFVGVTAMFWLLRMQPNYQKLVEAGHLEVMFQGGSPMPPELGELMLRDFPNAKIGNGFGMTETTSIGAGSLLPPEQVIKRGSSIGWPTPPTLFKVVDDQLREVPVGEPGELLISGAGVCRGYWNLPEKTSESFVVDSEGRRWHRSGDVVVKDEEGFYTIVDRKKDMILRGGENVYSVEVENLILTNPKVLQAAVVGVPDPVLGEKIKAVVFPMPGHSLSPEEVVEFCRGKIADYKVPDYVVVSETPLPMNPGGKIIKDRLREL
ncbi:class I adenylate-forming enzyme family protein [Candidatus Solincola sp.]|nr:class I adenylate-forming enzyme family protein [Actinomycetota bacterium]MDI7251587.1 class I adenylate-forming enzyme family protein [Actinomycetota bacterium]